MEYQDTYTQETAPQNDLRSTPQHEPVITTISMLVCCIGMLAGIIIALYGAVISVELSGNYNSVGQVRFGADFYTEIHAATAAAANNIDSIGNDLTVIGNALAEFRIIPIAIGLFMFLFFALKLGELKRLVK